MVRELKVELYAAIRRDLCAGMAKLAIERKHHIGHDTIDAAMESAWPQRRKSYPARDSELDPFKPVIDAMLRVDLDAPRKQHSWFWPPLFDFLAHLTTACTGKPSTPTQPSERKGRSVKITEYKILDSIGGNLEQKVNEHIADGWVPCGASLFRAAATAIKR